MLSWIVKNKQTVMCKYGGRTNGQCLVLIKIKRGSLSQMFSCCASSRMFTAAIIDFPVYLGDILWVDKITGHTLTYKRSLGIVGT